MSVDRLMRAGLWLALAAIAGCASATGTAHDFGNGNGDGGDDASIADLEPADQAVPIDLTAPIDLAKADLTLVCSTDAGDRMCSGKCVTSMQCCTNTDCPQPTNGAGICTNNNCGIACNIGYKPCGSRCIPNANCCVDGDCTSPGDPCKLAAGATCQSNGVCNYLPVTCTYAGQFCNSMGTCVCPSNQHVCQAVAACIANSTCCTSGDCSAIAGQVCPTPGSTCTCLAGFKSCVIPGTFSQCILATGCCTNTDCVVAGQTCTGPGGTCQCPSNQKVCGSSCIPSANCCTDSDCSSIGSGELCVSGSCQCPTNQHLCNTYKVCIANGTCCIDSDCPLAGQHCSGIGGSCACPSGQHQCASTGSCISNSNCCQTSECSVSGQSCVGGPPGTCQCAGGKRVCTQTNTCIPTSTCCVSSDCIAPPNTHVTATSCSGNVGNGGVCVVTGCNTGYYDINGLFSDGCECPDTLYGQSCGSATGLATLGYNDSRTVTSQLPASGSEQAWFLINFPSNGSNPSTAYHPHIALTQGGGEYLFDVMSNCGGALAFSCNTAGDSGNATNLTSFDVQGGGDYGTNTYSAVPAVGTNGQVYIRVHRANTSAVSCNPFTLVISD